MASARIWGLLAVSALAMGLAGCGVQGPPGDQTTPQPGEALLRVAHAAEDVPAFDVCVNDEVIIENARFGRITDFADVVAGSRDVVAIDAGGDCNDDVGIAGRFTFTDGDSYTAVVLDDENPVLLEDDLSPVRVGRARIRVINASPDSLAVDVEDVGGVTLLDDIRFNEPDDYDYAEVQDGTYDVVVVPLAGDQIPLELGDVELEEGHVYTVFVFGHVDPQGDEEEFDAIVRDDGLVGVDT